MIGCALPANPSYASPDPLCQWERDRVRVGVLFEQSLKFVYAWPRLAQYPVQGSRRKVAASMHRHNHRPFPLVVDEYYMTPSLPNPLIACALKCRNGFPR